MTRPDPTRLLEVLDATWPAARFLAVGPWCLRQGEGGGQRVSSATATEAVTPDDIASAENGMKELGQRPLFMVRNGDEMLDAELERRGYEIVDPVVLYLASVDSLAGALTLTDATKSWPPLAIQRELWAHGGIGPARIAVMERASEPRTSFLGRSGDTPCGTGFVSGHDGIAMVHALEVHPGVRRKGVGAKMMRAAANWAKTIGLDWISLAVTRANVPGNALYCSLGMHEATGYHYRRAPGRTA
ncbi:MAG: GNAT family N-acetyltransferase [Silicimonas sp.]|nr:GNAT family N-acetyltransferase [Silicimonas sp.]